MSELDLGELQALPIPHASAKEITFTGVTPEESADYVSHFLPPRATRRGEVMCAGCGDALTGLLFGTFEWGIANGEGRCSTCGYPTRMYHRLGGHCVALPLQYHPDELEQHR
jgi:hypothetical protein